MINFQAVVVVVNAVNGVVVVETNTVVVLLDEVRVRFGKISTPFFGASLGLSHRIVFNLTETEKLFY